MHLRAAIEQRLRGGQWILMDGMHQRGPSITATGQLRVRAVAAQKFDGRQCARARGNHERGQSGGILLVRVRAVR